MQSPEARQYDEVLTPDSGGRGGRNFGVRRRKFGAASHVENARDGRAETQAFAHVRRTLAHGRQHAIQDFNFSSDADARRGFNRNGHSNGGGGKYIQQPRAARISIQPGASIMRPTTAASHPPPMNEEERRLNELKAPPKKMDSFLENVVNKKRVVPTAPVVPGARRVPLPQANVKRPMRSLENASAPTATSTVKKPLPVVIDRGNWKRPTRLERPAESPPRVKRARVDLTPSTDRKDSGMTSGATRASARIQSQTPRNVFGMYDADHASTSNSSVASRYGKKQSPDSLLPRDSGARAPIGPRRSTRSTPKDGTQDMPIHLSDSEEDEDDLSSARARTSEDGHAEASDDDASGVSAIPNDTLLEYKAIRAWFGERPCLIDVSISPKVLQLRSVRGVESEWPFERNWLIRLKRIKRLLIYLWTPDQVGTVDTTEPAGKVMSTASFVALQFPIPDYLRKSEWREFYDPDSRDSSSKRYLIMLANDDDRDGTLFSAIKDVITEQSGGVVAESLNTLEDVRAFAKSMIERDHHYAFRDRPQEEPKRPRRRREADGEAQDAILLTYPLPPCTVDLVTITRQDVSRLQPAEYLNDNIIDYYLKRLLLVDFGADELVKQNVLFLSSHFYSRLRAGKGVSTKERLAAGYQNVSTWLTRSDLFNRTLIFVPINKDLHWSLALIVNPKCAGTIDDSDDENDPQTCIALLDPLGSYHSSIPILRNLKSFLEFEWERYSGVNSYKPKRVLNVQAKAPRQTNSFDCGVFVLKYAQEMLINFSKMLASASHKKIAQDGFFLPRAITDDSLSELIPHDAFTSRDVTEKRKELQTLLEEDQRSYEAILDGKADAKPTKSEVSR